jgi:hypothetical protein
MFLYSVMLFAYAIIDPLIESASGGDSDGHNSTAIWPSTYNKDDDILTFHDAEEWKKINEKINWKTVVYWQIVWTSMKLISYRANIGKTCDLH